MLEVFYTPLGSRRGVSCALPPSPHIVAGREFSSQRQDVLPTLRCTRRPRHLCSVQPLFRDWVASWGKWGRPAFSPYLFKGAGRPVISLVTQFHETNRSGVWDHVTMCSFINIIYYIIYIYIYYHIAVYMRVLCVLCAW